MITSIESVKRFGIYEDYTKSTSLKDFKKFNLFYGWNGSGKSTLSRLFQTLEEKNIHDDFSSCKFSIKLENSNCITQDNLVDYKRNIFVFNKNFIETNIEWDGTIKSILLLSEKKIKETKEYDNLKRELYGSEETKNIGIIEKYKRRKKELASKETENTKQLSIIAKNIKMNLKLISTNDTYYSNYNKTKVEAFISENIGELKKSSNKLNVQEVDQLVKRASPMKRELINKTLYDINIEFIVDLEGGIKEVLTRVITAEVINKLKEDTNLSNWVEKGLEIHKSHDSVTCEFCGSTIPNGRIEELENHYNDQLKKLKEDIFALAAKIHEIKISDATVILDRPIFYPEFQSAIDTYNFENDKLIKEINKSLEVYLKLLKDKENNPFSIIEEVTNKLSESYSCLVGNLINVKEVVESHNKKTQNFEKEINMAKKKLEFHYLSEQLKDSKYFRISDDLVKEKMVLKTDEVAMRKKEERVVELEAILSNEALGAEEFNNKLEGFLGYSEIKLVFNTDKKGYQILRKDTNQEANNLSEGEKTSIAFIYFMIKIKENGNNISDSIIVIDDPISSFDSNKIFHSYAYLKYECKDAKQLFILTHNYNYYYLVLGWFKKENKKDDITGKKVPNWLSYKIEPELIGGKRVGSIKNAGVGLSQTSEYDYVFYNVYKLKGKTLSREEQIYCGNIARKLIESFLSFKFPNQRGDLAQLMEVAYQQIDNEVENGWIKREEIYKFINIYSHNKKISTFEELDTDILESSSANVIDDIFEMMELLDCNHYSAMQNWADKEIACC